MLATKDTNFLPCLLYIVNHELFMKLGYGGFGNLSTLTSFILFLMHVKLLYLTKIMLD